MTSLKVFVLKILLLEHVVSGESASFNQCVSMVIPHGYVNCSHSPCHVTCDVGYFRFGPQTVRCMNGTAEDWKLSKCVGVRLVGGSVNGTFGRVELEMNGTRGSVSNAYSVRDKRWSLTEATVVCRMFGFAKASFAISSFKAPNPPSVCLLQHVKCKGNESSISQCSHSGLKRSSQWHCSTYTAGVVCGNPKMSFRIRRFFETIRSSGGVEVSVDGVWSALSYQGWTLAAGHVACKMFGLPNAVSIPESSDILGHTGLTWFRVKHCFGNESSLVDCSLDVVVESSSREAGVMCGQPKVSFRITRFSKKRNTSGRVEVSINGVWSALSYQGWTLAAANVACRMFGLPNATSIPESSGILGRLGQELLRVKHCFGNESSLVNCSLDILKSSPVDSNSGEAGVICGQPQVSVSVHLLEYGSTYTSEGKSVIGNVVLEIEGVPGRIGTTNWNDSAVKVLCRMLNITGPHFKVTSSRYGPYAFWRIWMDKVKCSGNERSIVDCHHPGLRNKNQKVLFSSSTAVVGCGRPEISLRLTGGLNDQEGNIEAYINGVMVFLDINDENKHIVSKVICRTLGLPPPSMIVQNTKFVTGRKQALELYLTCTGDERNISECKLKIDVVHSRPSSWLHGISCSTGYQCPLGCTCNLDSSKQEVKCINSNITETMDPIPTFIKGLSLVNEEKTVLEERHLLGLPIHLTELEIKGYEILQLKRKYFVKLEHLEELILYQNNIKNIEPWTISRTNMKKIDIQNNNITRLRKHAFMGVVGCITLILANNSIEVLEPEIFGLFNSMVFEGNKISIIQPGTFFSYNLPKEKIIDRLSDKEKFYLSHPIYRTVSTYLSLERNRIATIKPSAIGAEVRFGNRYATHLNILILTENSIRKLNKTVFAGLPLQVLFLNRNPLEVIEKGVFNGCKHLKTLNFKDTRIQQLSSGIAPPHTSIHVYKSQSPLVITCYPIIATFYYERGYKYHPNRNVCETCVPGSYKVGTRDGTCVKCPAGGFYQDEEAQYKILSHGLGCKQCPPGSFVPEEQAPGKDPAECQACPEGTRRDLPAMFRACLCLDDHYRLHRFQKCMPCDEAYQCINESLHLLPGFYWKWSSTDAKHLYTNFTAQLQVRNNTHDQNLTSYPLGIPKAYACPVAKACQGGLDSECSLGYEGPLCAVCSKGFYMLASTCRKCPSLPWIIAQVVLITAIVTGLLIFMIKEKKTKSNKRSLSDAMTARLKIVLGFFQVTSGTISGFSYIKWPDVMISVIKYAELLQMNLLQIAPPQCLHRSLKTDIHVKLVVTMVCSSAVVILGLLYYYIQTRCNSRNGQENEDVRSSAQQQCFRAVFLILFISYPLTSSHIFMVLPEACHKICTTTDETICNYYLKSDYTVRCDSQRFFWFSIFARVLLVYPVGFPLLVLYFLWKHYYRKTDPKKKVPATNGISVGLRFLYENYADDVWYWEIIELVRKVILTSVILLLDADSRFSIGITAMISGLYSISFAYFKPMTDVFEHWLQLTSLLATLVNMIVGILLVAQSTGQALDGAMIKVLLMAANVAVVAIMAARYLIALGQTFLAIRRNPHCSLSCCLYLFLTLNEAGNEMAGVDISSKGLKRNQKLAYNIGEPQLDLSQAGLSVELEKEELS